MKWEFAITQTVELVSFIEFEADNGDEAWEKANEFCQDYDDCVLDDYPYRSTVIECHPDIFGITE